VVHFATKPELSTYLDELALPEQQQFAKFLGKMHPFIYGRFVMLYISIYTIIFHGLYFGIYHGIFFGIYLNIYHEIYRGIYYAI
jgi:MFS superfamily sulfate permease-like transporter